MACSILAAIVTKDYLEDMDYFEDKDRMTKAHISP
jgi:hypothetical protein